MIVSPELELRKLIIPRYRCQWSRSLCRGLDGWDISTRLVVDKQPRLDRSLLVRVHWEINLAYTSYRSCKDANVFEVNVASSTTRSIFVKLYESSKFRTLWYYRVARTFFECRTILRIYNLYSSCTTKTLHLFILPPLPIFRQYDPPIWLSCTLLGAQLCKVALEGRVTRITPYSSANTWQNTISVRFEEYCRSS